MDKQLYFKKVSFNDDFDMVADIGGENPLYLKLVRNIVEISDEQELTSKELNQKPIEKGQNLEAGATSSSTVKNLEREVERLKKLLKGAHTAGWIDSSFEVEPMPTIEESWQQFKTENNL